ncbi:MULTISPECIES: transglycosylase family protein [unclassified Nocardioides]|uniref:transglycosylase family protein n=1 Tax=unclassified Nocardioides TaxID=2615069 RepID=UPI0026656A13|nr:transglycosylase family protein [Nocardioides sp. Arc9.136]WKN49735.1 transglycosylase family protein [Nocardioides sp. Arc9.136]
MRIRTLVSSAALAAATLVPVVAAQAPAQAAPERTWDRLAQCESGGRWHIDTGNGYYGGLQISKQTWDGFGGRRLAPYPHGATKAEQIRVAERIQDAQGWGAWPACSQEAGLR